MMIVDTPELRSDVREFLTSRRAKITPQQAGLPRRRNRRVPGLRRTEVASLAGMSVEYYSRLERGTWPACPKRFSKPSPGHSNWTRRSGLTFTTSPELPPRGRLSRKRAQPESVRQSLQATLDAITTAPALINNGRGDMIAANALPVRSSLRCSSRRHGDP